MQANSCLVYTGETPGRPGLPGSDNIYITGTNLTTLYISCLHSKQYLLGLKEEEKKEVLLQVVGYMSTKAVRITIRVVWVCDLAIPTFACIAAGIGYQVSGIGYIGIYIYVHR